MKKNLLKVAAFFFMVAMSVSAMAQTVALQEVKKDSAVYDSIERFTLTNDWIRSTALENYVAADLGGAGLVRGAAVKDGKFYFPFRDAAPSIIVVDGATGNYEKTIPLVGATFSAEVERGDSTAQLGVTLANNDLKFDNAGNCLVGPCTSDLVIIYKVDLATGESTPIIKESLKANPDTAVANKSVRFDAFGVYGDVNGDAIIMAMNANAIDCWRWVIEDGVVTGLGEYVMLDPLYEGGKEVNPGSAPQIMPINETLFYVDGNGTFPTLYQYEEGYGTRIDCFYEPEIVGENEAALPLPILGTMNQGHNGIKDFTIEYANGATEYFLLCAATNTAKAPASSFALIKYADENLSFADAELIYQFPEAGFGAASNAYRSAPVFAEVREEAGENGEAYVDIYVYVGENGMGKYTLTAEAPEYVQPDAVENVTLSKVYTNGGLVVADGEIEIFTVTGQNVTSQNGKLAQGAYIVRAANGATKVFVK